ncbi:glutamate receptor ionotropic, kainate 3-like [Liolophura sinensis]|uniref:glutamate receptor ionotropic, kainate 3-like n=1 Tax=Liolophura sinensis TaxID=3198878 RepID=UPI003158FB84
MAFSRKRKWLSVPFTITSLRENVNDFSVPFLEDSTGILTVSPGYGSNKSLFQTIKSYSVQVWICVLCSVFVIGGTSLVVNRFTPFGRKPEARPFQAKYECSLEDNMWMAYSSVTKLANLAAFLTVSLPPPPINTLGELLAQDKIQPIVQAGKSFETVFKDSTSELYMTAWNRMKHSPQIPVQSQILDLISTGQFAYVGDRPLLDYIASNSCLTFSVAAGSFDAMRYGMVLPQGARYARTVNHL